MSIFDSSLANTQTSSLLSSLSSNNTPQKRISEIFETSATQSGGPMVNLSFYIKLILVLTHKTKKIG
jgi:hypothetical protein